MSTAATRPPTARLFLALWPSPAMRQALHEFQLHWRWPQGAALVDPARLHITLHFLGQVPVARAAEFRDALSVPFEPHVIAWQDARATVWPGGIAVLEFAPPPALQRLHVALAGALRTLPWPVEERRFRPHVTFARRAQGAQPPADAVTRLPGWPADSGYVLVHSVPGRGYEVLHSYGIS
jgi:RNA 2',3'-cyclic 3'-phosphodiesterase